MLGKNLDPDYQEVFKEGFNFLTEEDQKYILRANTRGNMLHAAASWGTDPDGWMIHHLVELVCSYAAQASILQQEADDETPPSD